MPISCEPTGLCTRVPQFLDIFEFRTSPACAELLRAVDLLRGLNETGARHAPDDAPIGFMLSPDQ